MNIGDTYIDKTDGEEWKVTRLHGNRFTPAGKRYQYVSLASTTSEASCMVTTDTLKQIFREKK